MQPTKPVKSVAAVFPVERIARHISSRATRIEAYQGGSQSAASPPLSCVIKSGGTRPTRPTLHQEAHAYHFHTSARLDNGLGFFFGRIVP
jgi:hypothetical protein